VDVHSEAVLVNVNVHEIRKEIRKGRIIPNQKKYKKIRSQNMNIPIDLNHRQKIFPAGRHKRREKI